MNPSSSVSTHAPEQGAPRLADLIEELTNRLQAGEAVDLEAYAAQHPEHASAIRDLLPALQVLAGMSGSATPGQEPCGSPPGPELHPLGDFRLVREVGRGGMGIVYEAEQLSLGRRVALKVLPFAATMDPRHLQRFHNEARAAAGLHHTNIVPVFAVGCERGVHYYAMQLIEGQTLAAMIQELRRRGGQAATEDPRPTTPHLPATPGADTAGQVAAAALTEKVLATLSYFRTVADLGVQAAEALEYAHRLGVVHRDVKPANLMVDGRGNLWVTDFGLAQARSDVRLTQTGDLLGTLRYMSPEQALAKHGLVDHRTDVYSLGATLYELLALRPAVDGKDREEVLRNIAFAEPRRLRQFDRRIPTDLETVIGKAMAKEPADRYATAIELAEDLRRYLEDRPIVARRPSLLARATRWSRRHRSLLAAAGAGLVVALVALATSLLLTTAAYREERLQRRAAEESAGEARKNWEVAVEERGNAARNLTEAVKQGGRADANLRKAVIEVDELLKALGGRDDSPRMKEVQQAQSARALKFFQELLRENDLDPAGRRLAALAYRGLGSACGLRGEHVTAAEAYGKAVELLKQLATDFPEDSRYPADLEYIRGQFSREVQYTFRLADKTDGPQRRQAFEQALLGMELFAAHFPDDFWTEVNRADAAFNLGNALWQAGQPEEAEKVFGKAVTYQNKVLAGYPGEEIAMHIVRWELAQDHTQRGLVRMELGRVDGAKSDCETALALLAMLTPREREKIGTLPYSAEAHTQLGRALCAGGEPVKAAEEFRVAEREWTQSLTPRSHSRRNDLAWLLATCPDEKLRDPGRAVNLAAEAVKLSSTTRHYLTTLGVAYYRAADWPGAVEAFEKAANLGEGSNHTDFFLAMARWQLGDKEEARKTYDRAVEWMEKNRPRDEELRRFRAEAATLLGAKGEPPKRQP